MSGEALRVPGGRSSQISWQSTHEGGKVVSLTHWSPLPPRRYFWYSFLLEAEGHNAAGRLYQWTIPMTLSGNEPATFRFISQCLNRLRHFFQIAPKLIRGLVTPNEPRRAVVSGRYSQGGGTDVQYSSDVITVAVISKIDKKRISVCRR